MDKVFFVDTNKLTYRHLVNYLNGKVNNNYSNTEGFILETIKNLIVSKVNNVDELISDLNKSNERNGIVDFMNVLRKMPSFDIIEFGIDDIVRSGLVKEYLTAKMESGF